MVYKLLAETENLYILWRMWWVIMSYKDYLKLSENVESEWIGEMVQALKNHGAMIRQ